MSQTASDDPVVTSPDQHNVEKVRSIWEWGPTVDLAPIGVFRTTPDGQFSYVNAELAKIFGFGSPKEMLEQVHDIAKELLVNPTQRTHFKTVLETNKEVFDFIYDIKTKHKGTRQASLTARLVKTTHEDTFYEGFLCDVTEQHETQSRLEDLLRDVQGMAYRCEPKPPWRMSWVSAGCGELTGYTAEDLLKNAPAYETLIYEEYRKDVADAVENAIRTKTTYTLSYPIRTASNEKKWVFEKGKVVWEESGKPRHLEGFVTSANRISNADRDFQALQSRTELQKIRFRSIFLWIFIIQFVVINLVVLMVVFLKAAGLATSIGDAALIGFFTQTVAQVVGFVYLIGKYVFMRKAETEAPIEPDSQRLERHPRTNTTPQVGGEENELEGVPHSEFHEEEEEEKRKGKKVRSAPKT
jgi:PAS domain-containing protein